MDGSPVGIVVVLLLIAVYTLWVLLPLVPATLIYWMFPNTDVGLTGPLAGLTLKTTGAFAAYLVVVLVTYTQIDKIDGAINALQRQYWTVLGKVHIVDAQGKTISSEKLMKNMVVETHPHAHLITRYGIQLRLVEEPVTVLKIPQYGEAQVDWSSGKRNFFRRTVELKDPIVIRPESSTSDPLAASPVRGDPAITDSSSAPSP